MTPVPEKTSDTAILDKFKTPDEFHSNRKFAARRPDFAEDTLSPYATLKMKIGRARGLPGKVWNIFGAPTSDIYCELCLNDEVKKKTSVAFLTNDPVWNWQHDLSITKPGSAVQIRVLHQDLIRGGQLLGYVEFLAADLRSGQKMEGWFVLSPPSALSGDAPTRIAKAIQGPCTETVGAVYLEFSLTVASGDASDEYYAWCLPQPEHRVYPDTDDVDYTPPGQMKALNAQHIVDQLTDIKENIFDDLLVPALAGVLYVLNWQEPAVSLFCLLVALGCSLRPTFIPAGILLVLSTLFVLLSSEKRRTLMSAHPALVDLDDDGYRLIAQLQDTNRMVVFIKRIIGQMDGQVVDEDLLHRFAAFSHFHGAPVCTFDSLKQQLRDSESKLDTPFASFRVMPYLDGTLVGHGAREGQVVCCVNPFSLPKDRKYKIKFPVKGEHKDHTKTEPEFTEEEMFGDELQMRLDFRWVSSPAVLALIPDVTETLIMEAAEPLGHLCPMVAMVTQQIMDIAQWKTKAVSMGVATVLYVLTLIFGFLGYLGIPPFVFVVLSWVQVVGTLGSVTFLFVMNAYFFKSVVAQLRAFVCTKKHADKKAENWAFYEPGKETDAPKTQPVKTTSAASSKETNGNHASEGGGGGFFGCGCGRTPEDKIEEEDPKKK